MNAPLAPRQSDSPARPFSRGDREGALIWIEAALETIAEEGADALRVERLARRIGVSKGSFYWFFDGLDDLRFRTLDHWKSSLNDAVFNHVRALDAPLEVCLDALVDRVFQGKLGRFDAAIRAWALREPRVQEFVSAIDEARLAFLEDLFADGGKADAGVRDRAHLFYRAFIAESYVRAYPGAKKRADYLKNLGHRLARNTPI
ncbi:MAG: helix-turn-helix domain-containing protein [Pseudomonadota bacterium]